MKFIIQYQPRFAVYFGSGKEEDAVPYHAAIAMPAIRVYQKYTYNRPVFLGNPRQGWRWRFRIVYRPYADKHRFTIELRYCQIFPKNTSILYDGYTADSPFFFSFLDTNAMELAQ